MKTEAIMKALSKTQEREMAQEALNSIPEGGKPAELPVMPEAEPMGPPDTTPPVETGEKPVFDEATGLPVIVLDKLPENFRNEDDSEEDDFELLL